MKEAILRAYHTYLKLEKSLSDNSVAAYEQDLQKLRSYCEAHGLDPVTLSFDDLQAFVYDTFGEAGTNTQTLSAMRASVLAPA